MHVDLYERIWLWGAGLLITGFLTTVIVSSGLHAIHPPSHMETVNPDTVRTEGEFSRPRVEIRDDGSALVVALAEMYVFRPTTMRLPAGKPVTFRMTSPDVIHGLQIVGTNANAMVIPGYVNQMTVTFDDPGEYLVVCNEYCGVSHHLMHSRIIVEEAGP